MSKTFNISPGGNIVVQGQPVVLDGMLTGGSATGLKGINVFLNGIAPWVLAERGRFRVHSVR